MTPNRLKEKLIIYENAVKAEGMTIKYAIGMFGIRPESWCRWKRTGQISPFHYRFLIEESIINE